MSDATVIRGAAHYNEMQAAAWQQRAETAEARVRVLEQQLSHIESGRASSPTCPHCKGVLGLPTRPGTLTFSAHGVTE